MPEVDELARVCNEVLDEHPKHVEYFRAGKQGYMGFLIGMTIRKSPGHNPRDISQMLQRLLQEREG